MPKTEEGHIYRMSGYGRLKARMHKFLRLFPKDGTAVGSWHLLSGFLGDDIPSDRQLARERVRYITDTAVKNGFIRRLPTYGRSPNLDAHGNPHRERLWTITDEGLSIITFLDFLELLYSEPKVYTSSYKPKLLFGPGRTEGQLSRDPQ